jgi:hypothetical protein
MYMNKLKMYTNNQDKKIIRRPKMYTNKLWMKLLVAGTMLVLLFTAACAKEGAIKNPAAEQALAEQGDAFMTSLKDGDFLAVYDLMSLEAQKDLDKAKKMAGSWVSLDSVLNQIGLKIAGWEFDKARVFTKNGVVMGTLDGRVEYADGKSGEVHLELEQQDGIWKIRSSSLTQ